MTAPGRPLPAAFFLGILFLGAPFFAAGTARAVSPSTAPPAVSEATEAAGARHVHAYRLSNGLDLVVVRAPELELAAVNLSVAVGSVDDPPRRSGLAHLLEHVTLGGSVELGSLDPAAEEPALERLDQADRFLREARRRAGEGEVAATAELPFREAQYEAAFREASRLGEAGEILGGRLEARGAIGLNATTGADVTQYFGWIPVSELEYWLRLEGDRLRHPIFRRFYSEREVVLHEIDVLTGGRPTLQQRVMEEVFPGGPQARSTAGNPEETGTLGRPEAFDFFYRHYRPENTALAVVGDVDPEAVRRLAERHLGSWQGAPAWTLPDPAAETASPPDSRGAQVPEAAGGGPRVARFNSTRAPIVYFAFPRLERDPRADASASALATLLASSELSPLRRRLMEEEGIVRDVVAEPLYPSARHPAVFLLQVSGVSGVEHDALVHGAREVLDRLSDTPDRDLAGAALLAEMSLAAQLDDPAVLASLLSRHQSVEGDWRRPFRALAELRALAPDDLRAAARRVLGASEREGGRETASAPGAPGSAGGPGRVLPPAAGAALAALDGPAEAVPSPSPGIEAFERLRLPVGPRVLLAAPSRPAPFTEALLVVAAGSGGGEEDEAAIAAEAFLAGRGGAGGGEGPGRELARLGITADHTVGREVTVFRFTAPTRHGPDLLAWIAGRIAGAVGEGGPSPAAWDRAAAVRQRSVVARHGDPWQRALERLDGLLWEEPPAPGVNPPGEGGADRGSPERFLARRYTPDRMVLAVWGETPLPELRRAVAEAFTVLPARTGPGAAEPPPPTPALRRAGGVSCLVDPRARPPALLLGLGGDELDDRAFYGWQLAAHILGSSHASRLHDALRVREPFVYTVEASCIPVGSRGMTLRIATQTDELEHAFAVIRREVERMAREEVSAEELDLARAIFRSRLALDRGSVRDRVYRRALSLLDVAPPRDLDRGEAALAALTPASLRELLERTWRPEALTAVVISTGDEALCAEGGP